MNNLLIAVHWPQRTILTIEMKALYLLIIILVASSFSSLGQDRAPLDVAKLVFAKDTFPDLEKHITGEYRGHPNGTGLPLKSSTRFLLLGQDDEHAVVNMTVIDSVGSEFDAYLHFVYVDDRWKITALRALAMTGIAKEVLEELKAMSEEEINQNIEKAKTSPQNYGLFASREEYEFEVGNIELTLASDNELIAHFNKNESLFNSVKDGILLEIDSLELDPEGTMRVGESLASTYQSFFISRVNYGGFQFGKNLDFEIGGMLDNTVGYLFVPENGYVPEMEANRIIMIREIGEGWYIYKTT